MSGATDADYYAALAFTGVTLEGLNGEYEPGQSASYHVAWHTFPWPTSLDLDNDWSYQAAGSLTTAERVTIHLDADDEPLWGEDPYP